MRVLKPGQIWEDIDHKWNCDLDIQVFSLLLSRDMDKVLGAYTWRCAQFHYGKQGRYLGAYDRFFTDEEVHQMYYKGFIHDICKPFDYSESINE